MKKGWLIVNAFVDSKKFNEIYCLLQEAFLNRGCTLKLWRTDELLCTVQSEFDGFEKPDFCLFWDKDIYLAKRLESWGVRLFNNAMAVEVCDNKCLTALALQQNDVPTPRTMLAPKTFEGVGYCNTDFVDRACAELGLPVVIKEAYGSFGAQVYLANDVQEAKAVIDKLGHKDFLMQEYIATSKGKDLRVNVVGDKVVATMLRQNNEDFRSNVTNGGRAYAYTPTEEQKKLAVEACRVLGLDFAGVDILLGETPLVCEVNSNPHFKSTLDCTGVNLAEHIAEHILNSL